MNCGLEISGNQWSDVVVRRMERVRVAYGSGGPPFGIGLIADALGGLG